MDFIPYNRPEKLKEFSNNRKHGFHVALQKAESKKAEEPGRCVS